MPDKNLKNNSVIIASSQLHKFIRKIFFRNGLSEKHAETAAYALVKANLRGVDSHGVARVPMYCERLRVGVANPQPKIEVSRWRRQSPWSMATMVSVSKISVFRSSIGQPA